MGGPRVGLTETSRLADRGWRPDARPGGSAGRQASLGFVELLAAQPDGNDVTRIGVRHHFEEGKGTLSPDRMTVMVDPYHHRGLPTELGSIATNE